MSGFAATIVMVEVHDDDDVMVIPYEVDWGSQTNRIPMPSLVFDSREDERAVERVESLSVNHDPPRVTRRSEPVLRWGFWVLGVS